MKLATIGQQQDQSSDKTQRNQAIGSNCIQAGGSCLRKREGQIFHHYGDAVVDKVDNDRNPNIVCLDVQET